MSCPNETADGEIASADSTLFSGMAYLGTIIGQLSFGYFVDRYGRKWGALRRRAFPV